MQRHVAPSRPGEDVPVRPVWGSYSENRTASDVALLQWAGLLVAGDGLKSPLNRASTARVYNFTRNLCGL